METPYSRFEKTRLLLRDELAIDRTILANERTLLAFLRSGVALVIAGVTIMHFADAAWFFGVGLACIPSGIVAAGIGVARYRRVSRSVSTVRRRLSTSQAVQQ